MCQRLLLTVTLCSWYICVIWSVHCNYEFKIVMGKKVVLSSNFIFNWKVVKILNIFDFDKLLYFILVFLWKKKSSEWQFLSNTAMGNSHCGKKKKKKKEFLRQKTYFTGWEGKFSIGEYSSPDKFLTGGMVIKIVHYSNADSSFFIPK